MKKMIKRAIVMVLDSFGVGEAPDAKDYGDEGSNTLKGIYDHTKLEIPNLKKLGLYNIDGIGIPEREEKVIGAYGKAQEKSVGKNSPIGHWEMSGYVTEKGFATYPNGFPKEVIDELIQKADLPGILSNERGSGTELLKQYGEESKKTGKPIIYTSADSVFQIAAHEDVIPVERLYEICNIAREILDKPQYNVGTVIARPFIGDTSANFQRTYHRKDFESEKFGKTMLDVIQSEYTDGKVVAIGKIEDLFSGRGIDQAIHTEGNADGIEKTIEQIQNGPEQGLIYTNLVDYDMLYGHRNDIDGYARALEYLDRKLPEILESLKDTDILILTADHGCDPATPSTDHSREYVPLLIYGKDVKENINIGTRKTFADLASTILDIFGLSSLPYGTSFQEDILK